LPRKGQKGLYEKAELLGLKYQSQIYLGGHVFTMKEVREIKVFQTHTLVPVFLRR